MKVVRYFHLREGPKGGHTAKVTGDTDILGQVDVQYSTCSKQDMYCKKIGRQEADKAPTKIIPLRYLPRELKNIRESRKPFVWYGEDFSYTIAYFLPKE